MRKWKTMSNILRVALVCLVIGMMISGTVLAVPFANNSGSQPSRQSSFEADRTAELKDLGLSSTAHPKTPSTIPSTIRVGRRTIGPDGEPDPKGNIYKVDEVDFKTYVKRVLPHEWIASWPDESLKAGAVAVKMYAWYWIDQGGKYPEVGADVDDSINCQVYKEETDPRTDAAVDYVWGDEGEYTLWSVILLRDDALFETQYWAGEYNGIFPTGKWAGRMSQWGSKYWDDHGKTFAWILRYYYGYDRQAVYDYAQGNWDKVCTDGYFWMWDSDLIELDSGTNVNTDYYNQNSVDCAHFVSCCIGRGGGLAIPSRTNAYGEPGAHRLGGWLVESGLGTDQPSVYGLKRGDVILYDWDGNEHYDHAALYLGNKKVASHSSSVWDTDWELKSKKYPHGAKGHRFIHIRDIYIDKGLEWLRTHQNPDGSWGSNVGYTSLATLAFLNYGIDESDPAVSKAINYILSNQHPDGSIYVMYSNYETSLAILPLVATHNSDYDDEIAAARDFLVTIQNDESEGLTSSSWTYGGWGYQGNSPSWSDLSNTQWSLMGLDAADLSKTSDAWSKGETYVARCQNLQATNPIYDATNDGGFTYQPPTISCCWGCNWDPKQSYGTMSAAGVWSLKLCGVDTSDQKVQAGLNWLRNNYAPIDTVGNPCYGDTYLYYYLLSFAKALVMTGIPAGSWQETASQDITNYIISQQHADGHWSSNEGDLFATEQAILALQTRTIPTDIQRLSYLTFILHSNADLHVYDPLGRHVGKNYETGGIDLEIPNATYTSNDIQNITVPELETGIYRIVLIGTGTGEYTLNVTGGVGNDTVSEDSYTGNITEGEVHDATVNVAMITWLTIHVEEPDEINTVIQAATGTGPVYFILEASEIEDLVALTESDMPEENPIVEFPHGLFGFNITGLTLGQNVTLIITFPSDIPTTAEYWKYGPNGSINNPQPERWYQIPIGSNDGDNIITIKLTDGGIGDDDGVENGVIVDQGGPGIPKAPQVPVAVRIKPETLNISSKGIFTAFITLPEPYNITDINISTVVCEGAPAVKGMIADDNKYIAKFDRENLREDLPTGDEIEMTVTGRLTDGTPFEGSDKIRVIDEE